jgi:hypothetical protein
MHCNLIYLAKNLEKDKLSDSDLNDVQQKYMNPKKDNHSV